MTHLCLVDPAIIGWTGHYAEYARAIGQQTRRMGHTFSVLARRTVEPEVAGELSAEPVFRYDFWHRFTNRRKPALLLNAPQHNWAFYQDLRRALDGRDLSDWVLFMPTIDHHQLLAWAWWLKSRPQSRRPKIILLFRYSYFPNGADHPWREAAWARLGFRWLRPYVEYGQVRLATDSGRLARQYQSLARSVFEVLPIPHTGDVSMRRPDTVADRRPLRFVTLGDARLDKGFVVVGEAIEMLCQHVPEFVAAAEFRLHAYISHSSHEPMLAVQERLARLGRPNIRLVTQNLSRMEYADFVSQADVVLLPYARSVYFARTSGPFTEALAAGKVVIVTRDTWMSDQLSGFGGGAVVDDGDALSLAQAILQMREHYQGLAEQANAHQPQWVAFHNPANFVELLLNGAPDAERTLALAGEA